MKILSEKENTDIDMECTFTEEEWTLLLNYAQDNIPTEILDQLMINWALVDTMKKMVETQQSLEGEV